ncbi:MAG TPA: M3 family metallopeptidase, partial [Nitrobacter sp.]|nr:M3 family metallopeptidase [Nitrobacter sp.]
AHATGSDILADTPLTLAETASIFGEKLVFEAQLAAEADPSKRKMMLAGKIDDMINSVVRQIAFFNFEKELHQARREKGQPLETKEINDIFYKTQKDALGPAFALDEGYGQLWSYIPHFIHTPFYVYAYAFGDCLVNSLYAVYEHATEGFAERYLAMLAAGGTKHYSELLKPFGLDARDPEFWDGGLSVISGMIDELEAMSQ